VKYIKPVREHFRKFPVFTIQDIKVFLSQYRVNGPYIHTLVHHLREKGELKRIGRGVYSFREEAEIVGFAFSPFYYGLQEALSLRGLWEQETNPVVITCRRVRPGLRTILGANVLVRKIERKMFFGYGMVRYYDLWLPVSDVEKTLIDFVYFREPLAPEVLREMKKRIRKKLLDAYLRKVPAPVARRVIGLLKA